MRLQGAQIVGRTLVEQGVKTVFGYPGYFAYSIAGVDATEIRHRDPLVLGTGRTGEKVFFDLPEEWYE